MYLPRSHTEIFSRRGPLSSGVIMCMNGNFTFRLVSVIGKRGYSYWLLKVTNAVLLGVFQVTLFCLVRAEPRTVLIYRLHPVCSQPFPSTHRKYIRECILRVSLYSISRQIHL
jgi:hypothetical protein